MMVRLELSNLFFRTICDEAVAYGAAMQGAIMSGKMDSSNIVILDVTSLSLGVNVLGDITSKVVNKNTMIPTKKTKTFATARDNQKTIAR